MGVKIPVCLLGNGLQPAHGGFVRPVIRLAEQAIGSIEKFERSGSSRQVQSSRLVGAERETTLKPVSMPFLVAADVKDLGEGRGHSDGNIRVAWPRNRGRATARRREA